LNFSNSCEMAKSQKVHKQLWPLPKQWRKRAYMYLIFLTKFKYTFAFVKDRGIAFLNFSNVSLSFLLQLSDLWTAARGKEEGRERGRKGERGEKRAGAEGREHTHAPERKYTKKERQKKIDKLRETEEGRYTVHGPIHTYTHAYTSTHTHTHTYIYTPFSPHTHMHTHSVHLFVVHSLFVDFLLNYQTPVLYVILQSSELRL